VDRIERLLGRTPSPCRTGERPLPGGAWAQAEAAAERARSMSAEQRAGSPLAEEEAARLGARYGSRFPELFALAAAHRERFDAPGLALLEAEVVHAMRHELARRLDDVILRRLGLWTDRDTARAALEPVSRWMAKVAGWSETRRRADVERLESAFRTEEEIVRESSATREERA
jgi:glycerol-3-phosphate dehydrogenase